MTLAGSFTLTVRRSRTVGQTDRQQDTARGVSGEWGGEREHAIPIPRQTVNAFRLPFHVASFHVLLRCVCPDDLTHPRWLWRCSAANLTATKGWPKESSLLLLSLPLPLLLQQLLLLQLQVLQASQNDAGHFGQGRWSRLCQWVCLGLFSLLPFCLLPSGFCLCLEPYVKSVSLLQLFILLLLWFSFSFCSRNAACKELEIIGIKLKICPVCNMISSYVVLFSFITILCCTYYFHL